MDEDVLSTLDVIVSKALDEAVEGTPKDREEWSLRPLYATQDIRLTDLNEQHTTLTP